MEEGDLPAGRVVAVRPTARGDELPDPPRLDPGRLALSIVVEGLPVSDLPAGARLRIGETVVVEVRAPAAPGPSDAAASGGLLEAGHGLPVPAEVLEGGPVAPGAGIVLEAVALPLTDVLDLHSFRPEDTQKAVTDYVGEARRAGLVEVRIIHGRGRGVQRATVRQVLAVVPDVTGFADAPPAQGGWGATIVRLRGAEDAPSA